MINIIKQSQNYFDKREAMGALRKSHLFILNQEQENNKSYYFLKNRNQSKNSHLNSLNDFMEIQDKGKHKK